jgi:hypothetical protein
MMNKSKDFYGDGLLKKQKPCAFLNKFEPSGNFGDAILCPKTNNNCFEKYIMIPAIHRGIKPLIIIAMFFMAYGMFGKAIGHIGYSLAVKGYFSGLHTGFLNFVLSFSCWENSLEVKECAARYQGRLKSPGAFQAKTPADLSAGVLFVCGNSET